MSMAAAIVSVHARSSVAIMSLLTARGSSSRCWESRKPVTPSANEKRPATSAIRPTVSLTVTPHSAATTIAPATTLASTPTTAESRSDGERW
jgi:hypothetical protein